MDKILKFAFESIEAAALQRRETEASFFISLADSYVK